MGNRTYYILIDVIFDKCMDNVISLLLRMNLLRIINIYGHHQHDIRWCLLQSVCKGNTASSVIFVIKSLYYYLMLYLILNVWETYYFLTVFLEMLFLMP